MNLIDTNILDCLHLQRPITATATQSPAAVDLQGYEGVAKVILEVGTVSGTLPTLAVTLNSSADNATFGSADAGTFTTVTASNNSQSKAVDTRAIGRYLNCVGTIGGTGTPTFSYVVLLIGFPRRLGTK